MGRVLLPIQGSRPGGVFSFVAFHGVVARLAASGAEFDSQAMQLLSLPPLALGLIAPSLMKRYGPAVAAVTGLLTAGAAVLLVAGAALRLALAGMIQAAGGASPPFRG